MKFMNDLSHKHLAPITEDAWNLLESEARRVLTNTLTARRVVAVNGPHGLAHAAVNLGRLRDPWAEGGIEYGLCDVLPLTEFRTRFSLARKELQALARGAKTLNLEPLIRAARAAAMVEERAVYCGLARTPIIGLTQHKEARSLRLPDNPADYPSAVAEAVQALRETSIDGPYRLVLATQHHERLLGHLSQYPAGKRIAQLLTPPVLPTPLLEGGLVLGQRSAFELTIGQDFTLRYEHHDEKTVTLSLGESMTFRTLDPAAVMILSKHKA